MKILITGYTTRMFNSQRTQGDYITFSYLLADMLKLMGHEVHHKAINMVDEIAYVYDYAFCGVAPLSSMTSGKVPETHYVMDVMQGRHAIYADDWSFCSFGNSVRYTLDRWEGYIKYKNFQHADHVIENTRQSLELMMKLSELNNARVLCPMFKWGDHEYLMRDNYKANLITLDPSAFVKFPTVDIYKPEKKIRQWLNAALSDHSNWVKRQRFTFPVETCGNRRKNYVLTESQTVRLMAASFGVVSVGYPSAGCGWWRSRYLNAAWAESLIYSDPQDAATMGEPYQGSAEYFESIYGSLRYSATVEQQREWLTDNIMKKDEAIAVLEKLIAK